jgi:branched-chain amino acid transport system substrate-binding protein
VGRVNVRLVYGDTQDDARATVNEFKKLIQTDGVQTIIMSRSKTAMPVNPLSKQSEFPLVATAGHPAFVSSNPYAFRAYLNANNEGSFLANKVYALGLRHLATVTIQDEWNLAFSTAFSERFRKLGGAIDFEETLLPADMDFLSVISRLKQVNPEGIFCNLQLAQSGPFIRKLREQGLRAKLFSNYWLQKPEVQQAAGNEAIEGLMFNEVDSARPKYVAYAKKLYPTENSTPGTYICYVAAASIIQALNNSQHSGQPKTFSQSLLSLEQVTLLDDVIAVRDREVQYPQKLRVIRNGLVTDAGL